jgi:hippurate hydrolase
MSTQTAARVTVKSLIEGELPSLVALRRDLHAHPELSYEERRTSEVVQRELAAIGVEFKPGLGKGTGVLGYLPATQPTSRGAVALRADMDALPIEEKTGKAYSSCTSGVMHACGHDGHTTILIGAARVLSKMERPRPVAFVFQRAEVGGGGADVMCKEGVLAGEPGGGIGAPVETIFGLHGWPNFELGKVASKPGPLLAATDDFVVTIRGTGSHAAYPQFARDAILTSAQIITALQSIVSRNVPPLDSVVVSVGAINAGTADNIIPETVRFIGTVRTVSRTMRALAKTRFYEIVEGTAAAMGCRAEISWREGYPVTSNDAAATERFFEIARATVGEDRVETVEAPTMGGEDFSYYGQYAKACFFLLGLRPKGVKEYPTLHQPDFDFNDDALAPGIEMMCALATRA